MLAMRRTDHPRFLEGVGVILPKADSNISKGVNQRGQGADEVQMDKTIVDQVQKGCGR